MTRQEGMVRLAAEDLEKAGFSREKFDFRQARLSQRGREQAQWVDGPPGDESLVFYAAPPDSRYTLENVYLLEWGSGPGRLMEEGSPAGGSGTPEMVYTATLRLEENQHYSPQVEEGEHWLWVLLPAPKEEEFGLQLQDAAPGPGKLQMEVWASTEAPASPDHHLRLLANGHPVLDEAWDGKGRRRLEASLPAGLLVEGENKVIVQAVGDTQAPADIVFVDWIELDYTRTLVARVGSLEFESRGQPQALRGLDGPVSVFDIGEAGRAPSRP